MPTHPSPSTLRRLAATCACSVVLALGVGGAALVGAASVAMGAAAVVASRRRTRLGC